MNYTVVMKHDKGTIRISTCAETSDKACDIVCRAENAPDSAVQAVYVDNPTPPMACGYGAPMGRMSNALDHDWPPKWRRAARVPLDSGGYDRGGAYWGLRPHGMHLYAVQDGAGNVTFVDAATSRQAKEVAFQ